MRTVYYLGPEASYTHQATLKLFPDRTEAALTPLSSIADVFASVQSSAPGSLGVVPIENSSNGSVSQTLDEFRPRPADDEGVRQDAPFHPDVHVIAETYVPVVHCLVGRLPPDRPSSSPLSEDLSFITTLYTHPQAWGQCVRFLSQPPLKDAEKHDASSTSRAAAIAAADPSGSTAAIASRLAAELNGLGILRDAVQDREGNETRFLLVRKGEDDSEGARNLWAEQEGQRGDLKSLIAFTITQRAHKEPGSLASALGVFSEVGLSLTSINTRPSGIPWEYIFYVEVVGSGNKVDETMERLRQVTSWCVWLGSWKGR